MTKFLSRDPGTFVLTFATWATLSGVSLVWPGDAFRLNPVYDEVARLGIADHWWGLGMIADASVLFATASWGAASVRAFAAIASAPPWFFFGMLLLSGSARGGLLSAAGGFDILGALGLAAAGTQWVHTLLLPASQPHAEGEPWT